MRLFLKSIGALAVVATAAAGISQSEAHHSASLPPGEEVEVVFHPLRQGGKRLGLLRQVTTLSNGRVLATNLRDRETAELE